MREIAEKLAQTMATNRQQYQEWEKVRIDRIEKLVPFGTDTDQLVTFMIQNEFVKLAKKQGGKGQLVPAIQLRYNKYQAISALSFNG